MRLGLHVIQKTVDQYLRELGEIAASSDTSVFFDTNILGYLYKLHSAARKEFFDWVTELDFIDGRLFIPAWSANEYLAKFKTGKFSEYAPSHPEQVSKSLISLRETASLFVDEDSLNKIGYIGTRDDFLTGFDSAIKNLEQFTSVFSQQFDTWSVHGEITSNLSNCVLRSDLAALCSKAALEGDARIAHRLPPGYKDAGKAENKYGDLIIWYEVLEQSRRIAEPMESGGTKGQKRVLFVTNDEKPDWVYAPAKRIIEAKGVRKEVANRDPILKLPDPRLVAEFQATVGHDEFYITTLPMLIKALSTVRPKDLENLASAIQIGGEDRDQLPEATKEEEASTLIPDSPSAPQIAEGGPATEVRAAPIDDHNVPRATPTAPFVGITYPQDALRDGAYETDAPGAINEIIRALRSHNWYTQNPAIRKIKEIRGGEFESQQWFVLGRNIYQAACGNAQQALEFLKNLDIELARFPQDTANHLLSGMLFEVYFNGEGQFRRRPKAAHIDQMMREVANDHFQECRKTLLHYLTPYAQWIPFKPGDTVALPLDIEIVSKKVDEVEGSPLMLMIQSVKFLNEERLCEMQDEITASPWILSRGPETTTAKQIKSELSDNYAIPNWAIRIHLNMEDHTEDKLIVPNGHMLELNRPPLPDDVG